MGQTGEFAASSWLVRQVARVFQHGVLSHSINHLSYIGRLIVGSKGWPLRPFF